MSYADHLRRHRRLTILRMLSEAGGYSANESMVEVMVNELGVVSTRDQVRGDLSWLDEQQLVKIETIAGLMVATLTKRGGEIAEGRASHPDVAKPAPRA